MKGKNNIRNIFDLMSEKNAILRQQAEESWETHGDVDISPGEWNFLAQVQQNKDTTSHLARRAGMSRQAAHKFYTNLREKGLVDVVEQSPRERLVVLTPLGKDCFHQYSSLQQQLEEDILDAVGEENMEALKRILNKQWLADDERQAQ